MRCDAGVPRGGLACAVVTRNAEDEVDVDVQHPDRLVAADVARA